MEAFALRVINEKVELEDKINKLTTFISSNIFDTLPKEDRILLTRQLAFMEGYYETLQQRIERFSD